VGDGERGAVVGGDDGVGRLHRALDELQLAVGDGGAERALAEPQLDARAEALGQIGPEQRAEGEDVGVEAHRGVGPGQREARAPGTQRVEHRRELVAAVGELVDLRGGRRGELALADDAVLLEVAQAHGQDVRARVGEAHAEVGEALGPEHQLAHGHQRPALSEDVERAGDPARVAVGP
jgi:hypothetical protein